MLVLCRWDRCPLHYAPSDVIQQVMLCLLVLLLQASPFVPMASIWARRSMWLQKTRPSLSSTAIQIVSFFRRSPTVFNESALSQASDVTC